MRRVLHVGPCSAPGGMAKVIEILSKHPPKGWCSDTLESHSTGSVLDKLLAWLRAKRYLKNHAKEYDVVHFHSAAGWSYRRKLSLAKVAIKQKAQVVFHIHSGQFDVFAMRRKNIKKELKFTNLIVLSNYWKEKLQSLIGECVVVNNPIDPYITMDESVPRKPKQLLLLGRYDKVKRHEFAFEIARRLREDGWELIATGTTHVEPGITGLGWISEQEKLRHLQESTAILIPSEFEGQPLVMLEALAAGCPVIASSKVPELPSCVASAAHDNLDEWLDSIISIIKMDCKDYLNSHDIVKINSIWEEVYEKLIES